MRVNSALYSAKRNVIPKQSNISNKKIADEILVYNKKMKGGDIVNKNVVSTEPDLDSIILKAQAENSIRQVKDSLTYSEKDGYIMKEQENTQINENVATAESIPMSNKKVNSIYDIPSSEIESICKQAYKACASIDKEGMTKAELYNRIESTFKEYLGEDFIDAHYVYGYTEEATAHMYFGMTLRKLGAYSDSIDDRHQIYREAKGYAGMSEAEMRTTVINKYPKDMTLRDCLLMEAELVNLGLETTSYASIARGNFFTTLYVNRGTQVTTPDSEMVSRKIYEHMLDMPANYEDIKTSIEAFRKSDGRLCFGHNLASSMDEMFAELFSWFGGSVGGNDVLDKLIDILQEAQENSGLFSFEKS